MLAVASDLSSWANRRDAQALLPQLIRRLVHATGRRVIRAGFRAGEGVQFPGWDGIVHVEQGNAFIPDGCSAWELGTSNNSKSKADSDYEKRTAKPGEVEPSLSAFIFGTPRRWVEKSAWAAVREAEGKWRGVRAYDADDMEEWLELAPAVHVWLSVQLGKRPEGAIDLNSFWKDWSSVSQPEIPREFVLAGRGQVSERVHEWLRSEDQTLAIKTGTREEALALFAATIQQLPENDQIAFFSRTIVVRNLAAWEQLTASEEPLIVIPVFDSPDIIGHATRMGHRVLVPLGSADGESSKTVIAPPLNRGEARKALVNCGFPEARALELATLARRNLLSFRRKVSLRPEVHQPAWARPGEARSIIPALLAGRWADGAEGDREFLSGIAQASYDSVNQTMVRWANETDPPVRNISGAWLLTSKDDAWSLLARYLIPDDLRRFEEQVLITLGSPDPRFELSKKQRYMAALVGKTPRHSGLLQNEVTDTLAFLGARGDSISVTGGYSLPDWTSGVVLRLLQLANADWRVWASLSHELPLLAEAAPDVFLSAIEKGLTGSDPVIIRLFTEQEDALFGRMYHTGVLWALETMAWNPEHLSHVASILIKLIRLIPAGNSANHVRDSLRGIFLLWHPQTKATLDQRLRVRHDPRAGTRRSVGSSKTTAAKES